MGGAHDRLLRCGCGNPYRLYGCQHMGDGCGSSEISLDMEPLVMTVTVCDIENGPVEIVDESPIKWWIFP